MSRGTRADAGRPEAGAVVVQRRVAQARVVGAPAGAGAGELVEDDSRDVVKRHRAAEQPRQVGQDLELAAGRAGRGEELAAPQHPALEAGHRALLLGPLGHRAGRRRRAPRSRSARSRRPRGGRARASRRRTAVASGALDHRVAAVHHQRAHLATELAEQLDGRNALAWQGFRLHAPHRGHVPAVLGVLDAAVAGQLVGLLSVLPAALSVALSGQAAVAGGGPAGEAQREREVDRGGHGVGAVDVLLDAASGQHHRAGTSAVRRGVGEDAGCFAEVTLGHAGGRGDARRPPRGDRAAYVVPARRTTGQVVLVGPSLGHQNDGEFPTGAGDPCQGGPGGAARSPRASARPSPRREGPRPPALRRCGRPRGAARTAASCPRRCCRAAALRSAGSMSSTGKGRPRSMPKARLPAAAAEDMQNRPL